MRTMHTHRMRHTMTIVDWQALIGGEFREMPGLSLSARDMQRLWGLDEATCSAVIARLMASGTLRRTTKGFYVRSRDLAA